MRGIEVGSLAGERDEQPGSADIDPVTVRGQTGKVAEDFVHRLRGQGLVNEHPTCVGSMLERGHIGSIATSRDE
jgi:hypothetical protein